MSPKNSTISLTVLSTILAVLLLGLGAYTYYDYKQDVLDQQDLAKEKLAMEEELAQLVEKYENVQALNSVMDNHLIESKKRIVNLLDTIRSNKPKLRLLIRFRKEMEILKQEKLRLFKLNDSIMRENEQIKVTLDEASSELNKSKDLRNILVKENKKLSTIVQKNRILSFTNLKGEGIRMKGNGKEIVTDKYKKVDRIKICFTIKDNPYSLKENKKIFLRAYNPRQELLGNLIAENHEGKQYEYSSKLTLFYKNQQVNSCASIMVSSKMLEAGTYTIKLYENHELRKTEYFFLK